MAAVQQKFDGLALIPEDESEEDFLFAMKTFTSSHRALDTG